MHGNWLRAHYCVFFVHESWWMLWDGNAGRVLWVRVFMTFAEGAGLQCCIRIYGLFLLYDCICRVRGCEIQRSRSSQGGKRGADDRQVLML